MPRRRTLSQDFERLRKLKVLRDKRKDSYEKTQQRYKQLQAKVFQRMVAEKVTSQTHDELGVQFVRASTVFASVQDREAFVEWAKTEAPELVEDRERQELINQLVREKLDNGEGLPPGLGFYEREYISQRGANTKGSKDGGTS